MKNQALFSSKDKSKKLKYRLLQFLLGALSIKHYAATKLSKGHTVLFFFAIFHENKTNANISKFTTVPTYL